MLVEQPDRGLTEQLLEPDLRREDHRRARLVQVATEGVPAEIGEAHVAVQERR